MKNDWEKKDKTCSAYLSSKIFATSARFWTRSTSLSSFQRSNWSPTYILHLFHLEDPVALFGHELQLKNLISLWSRVTFEDHMLSLFWSYNRRHLALFSLELQRKPLSFLRSGVTNEDPYLTLFRSYNWRHLALYGLELPLKTLYALFGLELQLKTLRSLWSGVRARVRPG
jgi:hypothetical protein